MTEPAQALTKQWYAELEQQSAKQFINLPIEFQLRGYDYNFLSKSYLNFFKSDDNSRSDKLSLAKKFLKFIRGINKNRAKQELGEHFFACFEYFMDNFSDLLSKQDFIHLDTLTIIAEAIDNTSFIEDVISVPELQRRVENLKVVQEKADIIQVEWDDFEEEYRRLN